MISFFGFDCFSLINNAILDNRKEFTDSFQKVMQLLKDYKQNIERMDMNDEYLSLELLKGNRDLDFELMTIMNGRREKYQNISEKLLKILRAYDKATTRSTIINSFQRVGITSCLIGMYWTMVIDISLADRVMNKYPEVKKHPKYAYLCERPQFQRTYLQVIIPNEEMRTKMEEYAERFRLKVLESNSSPIIEKLKEETREKLEKARQMNHPDIHVPRIEVVPNDSNGNNSSSIQGNTQGNVGKKRKQKKKKSKDGHNSQEDASGTAQQLLQQQITTLAQNGDTQAKGKKKPGRPKKTKK